MLFQQPPLRAARPRFLPRTIGGDSDTDPTRRKLQESRAVARLDYSPAGAQRNPVRFAPLAKTEDAMIVVMVCAFALAAAFCLLRRHRDLLTRGGFLSVRKPLGGSRVFLPLTQNKAC